MRSAAIAALLGAAILAGCADEGSEPAEGGAPALEQVGEFEAPVFLTQPPDGGSLYVVERGGTIRELPEDGEPPREPVLDIHREVTTEGEGGLFSLAFAPDFARSGLLYVDYAGRDGAIEVVEYRADPASGEIDPRSRRGVLSIKHPNFIHWGGLLTFGPDDRLYAGTGDGGPAYPIPDTAQNPRSLLGKLLWIDPRERSATPVVQGVRNPWRYSFDSKTGDLWIGDVGDFTQEEVDHVAAGEIEGANLGWPDLEGTAQTKSDVEAPGATAPVLTYERTGKPDDPVCAVTGGYVVRDPDLPDLDGRYVYGDFCEGKILSLDTGEAHPKPQPTGLEVPQLVSFAVDAEGGLYAISLNGPVYRIVQ